MAGLPEITLVGILINDPLLCPGPQRCTTSDASSGSVDRWDDKPPS